MLELKLRLNTDGTFLVSNPASRHKTCKDLENLPKAVQECIEDYAKFIIDAHSKNKDLTNEEVGIFR
jgi:Holliday junction resolvase RusA-like endonuclease